MATTNNYLPTPEDMTVSGAVITHKTDYLTGLMDRFGAPPMPDVFFINTAPKTTPKRVFVDPNAAIKALHSSGQKGKVYCNNEYMSIAAASKLDLQFYSNQLEGKQPGRAMLMTATHAKVKNTPRVTAAEAKPVDTTPNDERPIF